MVAHYDKQETEFDPDNPLDPSSTNIRRKFYLYLTSNMEGVCSFSIASGNKVEEKTKKKKMSASEKQHLIDKLTVEMKNAAKLLEFEHAAYLRDKIQELRES